MRQFEPKDREAVHALVKVDRQAAMEKARELAARFPNSRDARQLYAWTLGGLFEFAAAIAQYRRAAELGTTGVIEQALANNHRRLGNYRESADHLVRAMCLADATPETRALATNALQLAGDLAFARQVAHTDPTLPPSPALDFARWLVDFQSPQRRRAWRDRLLSSEAFADKAILFWQGFDVHPMIRIDHKDRLAEMLGDPASPPPPWWPQAYCLPAQRDAAQRALAADPSAAWVVKSPRLAGTQRVFTVRGADGIAGIDSPMIVQRYIDPPFLYDGRKVNIRLHVSVVAPFRQAVRLWHDGLVFISTDAYASTTHGSQYVNPLSADKAALQSPVGAFAAPGVSLNEFIATAIPQPRRGRLREDIHALVAGLADRMEKAGLFADMRAIPGSAGVPPTFFGIDVGLDADLKPWLFEAEISPGHGLGSPATAAVWRRFRADWLPMALDLPTAARAHFVAL
jgi:tetratricopeptide (TPR) repeat protein